MTGNNDVIGELGSLAGARMWTKGRQSQADAAYRELAHRSGTASGDLFEDVQAGRRALAKESPQAALIITLLAEKSGAYIDRADAKRVLREIGTAEAEAGRRQLEKYDRR